MLRNKGFSIVEVVIVIAVVCLIGLIGWRVWDAQQNKTTNQAETTQSESQDATPDIKNESDLDKASESLDATDIEGGESQQLDSETSF